MQTRSLEIFWARARGITLTPDDPFRLMIWSFDRMEDSPTAREFDEPGARNRTHDRAG